MVKIFNRKYKYIILSLLIFLFIILGGLFKIIRVYKINVQFNPSFYDIYYDSIRKAILESFNNKDYNKIYSYFSPKLKTQIKYDDLIKFFQNIREEELKRIHNFNFSVSLIKKYKGTIFFRCEFKDDIKQRKQIDFLDYMNIDISFDQNILYIENITYIYCGGGYKDLIEWTKWSPKKNNTLSEPLPES